MSEHGNGQRRGRRGGGRANRAASREAAAPTRKPYITRTMQPVELIDEAQLEQIEYNADTILEQVGIDFRDYPTALTRLADAGANVDGERVRFPRGMCREIVTANAPAQYTQHARNPANNVEIGGNNTVFVPNLSLIHI